jgi:hypothetical protein
MVARFAFCSRMVRFVSPMTRATAESESLIRLKWAWSIVADFVSPRDFVALSGRLALDDILPRKVSNAARRVSISFKVIPADSATCRTAALH